jgi:hypothetical protein
MGAYSGQGADFAVYVAEGVEIFASLDFDYGAGREVGEGG